MNIESNKLSPFKWRNALIVALFFLVIQSAFNCSWAQVQDQELEEATTCPCGESINSYEICIPQFNGFTEVYSDLCGLQLNLELLEYVEMKHDFGLFKLFAFYVSNTDFDRLRSDPVKSNIPDSNVIKLLYEPNTFEIHTTPDDIEKVFDILIKPYSDKDTQEGMKNFGESIDRNVAKMNVVNSYIIDGVSATAILELQEIVDQKKVTDLFVVNYVLVGSRVIQLLYNPSDALDIKEIQDFNERLVRELAYINS